MRWLINKFFLSYNKGKVGYDSRLSSRLSSAPSAGRGVFWGVGSRGKSA